MDLGDAGRDCGHACWFPATLAFGWYVTAVANYSRFYGSFGAGIATLVWLYITSFSALLGAELNGVLFRSRQDDGRLEQSVRDASVHRAQRLVRQRYWAAELRVCPPCTMKSSAFVLTSIQLDHSYLESFQCRTLKRV